MSNENTEVELIPTTLSAVVDGIHGATTPVKVSFIPYANQKYGTQEEEKRGYRYIEGEITGVEGYSHIKTEDDEWYIITQGKEFAPSYEEWFGEEVMNKMDEEDLPTPPLADHDLVLGKRASDNNGYIPIGVNIVILKPTIKTPRTEAKHKKTQYTKQGINDDATTPSEHITNVRRAIREFDNKPPEEAIESIDDAIIELQAAKDRLNNHRDFNPPKDINLDRPS